MTRSYFIFIIVLSLISLGSDVKGQTDSLNIVKAQIEFKRSCKCSINYPDQAEEKHIQGTVIISFDIDTNCSVRNIRVEKSVGYGCDEEAIRVIKECQRQIALQKRSHCIPTKDFKQPIAFRISDSE